MYLTNGPARHPRVTAAFTEAQPWAGGAEGVTVTGCDTAQVLAFLTMLIGLLAVLAGIGCAATAYSRTHAEHADVPLWPTLHRTDQAIRRLWVRYVLRHPGVTINRTLTESTAVADSVTAVVSGLEIDTDLSVEEQVRLLIHRVRNIENQASSDRSHFAKGLDRVKARVDDQAAQLRAADGDIRELARSIAVSTVKLQLWGLILVGGGTVLMAVPTLVSMWAAI
jgi:hypothetical protein